MTVKVARNSIARPVPLNTATESRPMHATLVLYAGGRPELSKSPMHAFMVGVSYSHGN